MFRRGFFVLGAASFLASGLFHGKVLSGSSPQYILSDSIWERSDRRGHKTFLRSALESGFSQVNLEVVGSTGQFYFQSYALGRNGWGFEGDALRGFSTEWSRIEKSTGPLKIRLSAGLSNLAWILWGDSPAPPPIPSGLEFQKVLSDLTEPYAFNEVLAPPFPPEYMPAFLAFFQSTRKKLGIVARSPYWDRTVASAEFDEAQLLRSAQRFVAVEADLSDAALLGRTTQSVGFVDAFFGWARASGKEVWMDLASPHPSRRNLQLYRALQYAPTGWIGKMEDFARLDEDGLKEDFREWYPLAHAVPPVGRKVANLILSSGHPDEPLVSEYVDPVVNALQANGFEVLLTFRKIEKGADLYYVLNGRDWLDDIPFFDALLDFMDHRKSRYFGPIIVHPLGEIGDDPRWQKLRRMFKVPAGEKGWIPDLPEHVVIRQKKTAWRANSESPMRGMTRLRAIPCKQNGAEVVLSQVFSGDTLALIVKSGPNYLVNGNFLHLEASYFLSSLMGGSIKSPSNVYITANRVRTCALAAAPSRFRFKPPVPEVRPNWRVVHFDAHGRRIRDERVPGADAFEADLEPFELLLIETGP